MVIGIPCFFEPGFLVLQILTTKTGFRLPEIRNEGPLAPRVPNSVEALAIWFTEGVLWNRLRP